MSLYIKEKPQYVEECFQSLLRQTVKADEWLVVEDGPLTPELYAVLDKNRGGERFIDAVLDFNGNTGFIAPNYSEPQPQQEEISNEENDGDFCPF